MHDIDPCVRNGLGRKSFCPVTVDGERKAIFAKYTAACEPCVVNQFRRKGWVLVRGGTGVVAAALVKFPRASVGASTCRKMAIVHVGDHRHAATAQRLEER